MQMLGLASEEGSEPGLGWIAARSRRFGGEGWDLRLKVPHMGWNAVRSVGDNPLLVGIDSPRYYFVHSYHVVCDDPATADGLTRYGGEFASMVRQDNIFGVQFHPEKSHRFGFALFRNFMERC
jgi:glutamine amidotransferase